MDDWLVPLTLATALGCGLNGGVFFAFSTFVMAGLGRLRPAEGVGAMQAINVTAVSPAFMTALFGTALGCLGVLAAAVTTVDGPARPYLIAGAATYLVGTILVTAAYHVPRNDALAAVGPHDPGAPAAWARYRAPWTAANHLRTLSGLVAAAVLVTGVQVA